MSAGAYRGYGATQGIFAVESTVNKLADKLSMDPIVLRQKNMIHEGDVMPAYYGETANSCRLEECLLKASDMIGWKEKGMRTVMPDGKIRARGVAMAMQGSSISNCDVGSVTVKLSDEGTYHITVGCTDMGTGCDTIIAQFAADVLETMIDNISVYGVDTDISPYDSGSYASSTTYLTGMAAVKACEQLREHIIALAAARMNKDASALTFDGENVIDESDGSKMSLFDIATASMCNNEISMEVTYSHSSPVSPPPFMAACAEVEVDPETGAIELLDYTACVDCGTVVNTNLARVQTEGGLLQGIGMTARLALPTLIALASIALNKPTVSSLAVMGEISIAGTMMKVDELANALQVCLDSGAKKVLLPITSAADLGSVPSDLIGCFNLIFYQSAEDAVFKALGVE